MSDLTVLSFRRLNMVVYPILFRFAKWTCDRLTEDADFGKKIIFSDEAHFDLGGYVNKHYCRIWGTENPHAYIEKPTHPKRITVWCGLGHFSSKMSKERPLLSMGHRYPAMLNEFCSKKIEEEDIGNIWFQQDGATCHTAEATFDVLHPVFEDRIISRRADVV